MRHIKLILEYDGTNYAGWQSQTNAVAIQDVVAKAIEKMTEEKAVLRGASRTDAGVHALAQVAAFETNRKILCDGFLKGLNTLLPEDIRVVGCEEVPLDFHPIRHAKSKKYRYLLGLGNPSALERHRAWWVGAGKLDRKAMEQAARCLIGEHDFKSFQGAMSDTKTTVRRLDSISFESPVPSHWSLVQLSFSGNGFLKYMIRNIVGTLVEIGLGKRSPGEMQKILEAKDRKKAGIIAPAHGLYLVEILYE